MNTKSESLIAKYSRLSADVLKKYGMTEEDTNLSGLPEEAPPIESGIISL